jgi:GH35 family endo-1,4-beta-xylanase
MSTGNVTIVSRVILLALVVVCGGSMTSAAGQKFLGCCYTPQSNPVYETKFKDLFTMVVPENAGKWDEAEDTRGVFAWGDFDKILMQALPLTFPPQHT